jgi:hypothetical protein
MKQASSPSAVTSDSNVKGASTFPTSVKSVAAKDDPAPKTEPTKEQLLLEWSVYDSDTDSADDMIAQGKSLAETSGAQQEPGEVGERSFELKLASNKEKEKLGSLRFEWWDDSSQASLMNFNIHSADLADFCRKLWPAAGRRQNQYCDTAIEFGDSPHSHVEVNDLIAGTFDSMDYETVETTYLDLGVREIQACQTTEQWLRLVSGLISLIGKQCTLITYERDLSKLHIVGHEAHGDFRLETLGSTKWYVRTADDVS